ncbi:MAG: rod shape-determining protein MreC [SAR86 cluster bacterium]|jgi:rod shape-determining protein MreC|uniref:Cell shape-determining protein MreC n=1 Tax=SAR86 cluster bacterium TaxID=2030880 RepID=A0A937JHH1_9GAMM|nr:rod shape-determining protein MreC [SAR86 cluster bacterium]
MARIAPGNTPKFAYVVLLILASLFIYLDLQYKTFTSTKNVFNSALLSSNLLIKNILLKPISNLYNLTTSKNDLIKLNRSLEDALETIRIENFLILNKATLFKNNEGLISYTESSAINSLYEIAAVSSFDTNLYKCCDSHKLFLFNNLSPFREGGTVINAEGILGQISDSNKRVSEVILISDINHSMPVKLNNFYCNANGTGRPRILECKYDASLWPESFSIGDSFYSSGLGGIFPEGILIGNIKSIKLADNKETILEIESLANPLTQNHVMVIYPNDFK